MGTSSATMPTDPGCLGQPPGDSVLRGSGPDADQNRDRPGAPRPDAPGRPLGLRRRTEAAGGVAPYRQRVTGRAPPGAPQYITPPGAPAAPSPGSHGCGPRPQPECVELCRALCARVAACGFDGAASCQAECEAVYPCPGESPGHDRVLCAFEPARVQAMPCRDACAMATRRTSCE